MSERLGKAYKRLCELRLLHHYWLDEGATVFDLIVNQDKKNARLLAYDRRPFFALMPTALTAKMLAGYGGIYKDTALGFILAIPEDAVLPADTVFEFVVTLASSAVYGYTALTLRPQKITELYDPLERKLYRYKENVPVFSNLTGVSRGAGVNESLYLSREIPAPSATDQAEALVLSNGALLQLTGDQPGAVSQQLGAQANALPVFVHQNDVPAISAPAGLTGVPARGILLSGAYPDTVFALIRLQAVRPGSSPFSFIDGSGHPKATPPVYQIRFKNRSTIWQYRNKSTGAVGAEEPHPLPLTHFGNAGTKPKPSAGLVKADISGNRVTRLVSEIFV